VIKEEIIVCDYNYKEMFGKKIFVLDMNIGVMKNMVIMHA
jgi:hypothetical protein